MRDYKVPSIQTIKKKFQKEKSKEDPWSHLVLRFFSRHITWLLLHITLFAELVALTTPIVDILVIYNLLEGNFILAAILTQVHIIVDCVDGEIARFRKTVRKRTKQQELFGAFTDSMAGVLVYPLVIFTIGYLLGGIPLGLLGMMAFYLTVISSAYVNVYFKDQKAKSTKIREKIIGKQTFKIGFSSAVQKGLITLTILLQQEIFLYLFILGSVGMAAMRFIVYRK